MKIKYQKIKVVDGDTVRILWNGFAWYLRIVGLDTDELGTKRGEKQKRVLERICNSFLKPKITGQIGYTRGEEWPFLKHHNGRFLAEMKFWRWSKFKWVNYAEYMKSKGRVKKGSRWNT